MPYTTKLQLQVGHRYQVEVGVDMVFVSRVRPRKYALKAHGPLAKCAPNVPYFARCIRGIGQKKKTGAKVTCHQKNPVSDLQLFNGQIFFLTRPFRDTRRS